jgi:TetR/AcrR family transcriptional regulator, copper-responsive repressor
MNKTDTGARLGRPITRKRTHVLETAMHAYWQDERAAVSVNAVCEP